MDNIKKEKDIYRLTLRTGNGWFKDFDSNEKALDYADSEGYEPSELKIEVIKGKWIADNTKFDSESQAKLFLKVKESLKLGNGNYMDSTYVYAFIIGVAIIRDNPNIQLNDLALDIVNEFGDTVDEVKEELEC